VKSNVPVSGVVKYRHPALGTAGVGSSAPARSLMTAVVRDKNRELNTGIALGNALDKSLEVKLSLRGLDGLEIAGGSASYTLAAGGHAAKLIDQWFPEADTSDFKGTVVASTEQTEEGITATAIQIGASAGEFTSLPVVPVDPAPASTELYFAQFAVGGVLRYSVPALGTAGVGASEPVEGFIAPVSRDARGDWSTGVAIASIGNPVTLSLTLRDESGKPVAGAEAIVQLRANGHVSR